MNETLSRVLMQEKIIEVLLKFTLVGYLVDQSKYKCLPQRNPVRL